MPKQSLKFTEPHLLSGYPKEETVLVALSGGADSTALLHRLCEYRNETGCKLLAAHVNHGIRGAEYGFEADRDEEFCRNLCASLDVELCVEHIDIPALAKESGKSLETEARDQRYAFLARLMKERNIKVLATAHNADDDLETQLFNFSRGCGIEGLSGIPEARGFDAPDGGIVIRPLLKAQKSEIIKYCLDNGVQFVTDSTNLEDDCTRNILRHRIIPELEALFPSLHRAAERLKTSSSEDSDFILTEAKSYLESENGRINAEKLSALHPSLAKRVLMLSFAEISQATLESVHLDALLSLAKSKKNGAKLSLPDRKQATVTDGFLSFGNETKKGESSPLQYGQKLQFGFNVIENTPFAVELCPEAEKMTDIHVGYTLYSTATLNIENTTELYAKNRSSGETILDGGINKKIKKLMCDRHVPLPDRDLLPIIRLGEEILYLPLCAVTDRAKPKKQERKTLVCINIYKGSSEV